MKMTTTAFAHAMREMFNAGLIDGMSGSGVSGLKCDNPDCDWEDMTIPFEDFHNHIDAPCPKCGENILTQEDFEAAQEFQGIMGSLLKAAPTEPEGDFAHAHLRLNSDTKGSLHIDLSELIVGSDGMVRKIPADG